MAEDLTDYMREVGIRVNISTRILIPWNGHRVVRDMRLDVFDVLVGINLLREGLDIPENHPGGDPGRGQRKDSCVQRPLSIQTIGRAAETQKAMSLCMRTL